ncbi:MAG: peptide chain release factor-like protein [Phycisphaerales bacterium]|nr:peptide chain release factor-like protein [Phycisphaerales bacterium]
MFVDSAAGRDAILALDDPLLLAQCDVHTYRSSGPGGQKKNKTDSAVRLKHRPTDVSAVATESRSQHENRARALRRLRLAIALHVRRPIDVTTYRRGATLAECVRDAHIHVGRKDGRFNPVAAEVLDVLAACGVRVSTAASAMGLTTAGLVAFLQTEPQLWRRVNEMRTAAGLTQLRT